MYFSLPLFLSFFLIGESLGIPSDERSDSGNGLPEVDVAVIGGGSSGTYAAVRLRDINKTVALIERKDRLGGHTETYTDPESGGKTDIGVIAWYNNNIVTNYFKRLDVPFATSTLIGSGGTRFPVNFRTGELLTNYTPADPSAALAAYGAQQARYPTLQEGIVLPSPVPEDLLLPFGEFVQKYNLGDAVFTIASFNQGQDVLKVPTLYVFKLFSLSLLQSLATGFVTTANRDNSELYRKATAFLSPYLSTTVLSVDRSSTSCVRLTLATPSGLKTLTAKKLLIAVPPLVSNLAGFDLSANEISLFSQFTANTYETGVIRNSGIPDNTTLRNIDPAADPYGVPALPAVYVFSATGLPNLVGVKYGANGPTASSADQTAILNTLNRIRAKGQVPGVAPTGTGPAPSFATYSSHQPFELTVSTDAIRNGFYSKLYALQGQRNTWYTGAAWDAHDSSGLWAFTERLLSRIFA